MQRYHWETVPKESLDPWTTRQVIHTPYMTVARVTFQKGASSLLHDHVHEQMTIVDSGKVRFHVDGEDLVLEQGEMLRIPSRATHMAEALEDTVLIDIFSPARTDWQS